MKINSAHAFSAARNDLRTTPLAVELSVKKSGPDDLRFQEPPQYRRSEIRQPNQQSENSPAPDEMHGARRSARRSNPYQRPVPSNPVLHPLYDTDLGLANEFAVCKLHDQMKAMIPGDPSILDFNAEGRPYQLKAFRSGMLMIDCLNPNHMLYSMIIGPNNAVGAMRGFPGGQERLAGFLTAAAARLQYVTS